jgi:hypothetical protein
MEKEEQRLMKKFLWLKDWGAKRIHEELMSTLGNDSYGFFQITIWNQKFANSDLPCKDPPRSGRLLLTLEPQLEAFMQKYQFANARIIAQHFLRTVPTIKDVLQRELGMRTFSRRWVPHFLSPAQNVALAKHQKQYCELYKMRNQMTLKELQRMMSPGSGTVILLQQCLRGRHLRLFQGRSKQLARKTMITIFFAACQPILFDVLPKGCKFNQQYFIVECRLQLLGAHG